MKQGDQFRLLFLFPKKAFYEVKTSGLQLRFKIIALYLVFRENKVYETLYYESRDMLDFDFLEKGLGIVSLPHFKNNF